MDELEVGASGSSGQRHAQGVEDEVGARRRRELPADHAPAVDVDDEGEEDQAFPAAKVREVRDPKLIQARGGEVAIDQVGRPAGGRVGDRGAPRLAAALGALQAVHAHQPLDAVAPDVFDAGRA
jgi:hypothetical protein